MVLGVVVDWLVPGFEGGRAARKRLASYEAGQQVVLTGRASVDGDFEQVIELLAIEGPSIWLATDKAGRRRGRLLTGPPIGQVEVIAEPAGRSGLRGWRAIPIATFTSSSGQVALFASPSDRELILRALAANSDSGGSR